MRRSFAIPIIAGLFTLSGCNTTESPDDSITWHSGFTLPDLLEAPPEAVHSHTPKSLLSEPWYAEFVLASASLPNQHINVNTCLDYLSRQDPTLRPIQENQRNAFLEIALMCQAAELLASAKAPKTVLTANPLISFSLPQELPVEVAMILSESERAAQLQTLEAGTWGDANTISRATATGPDTYQFEHEQGVQSIALVARADFTEDGVEDILISSKDSVVGGNYYGLRLFLLSPVAEDNRYQLIRQFPETDNKE